MNVFFLNVRRRCERVEAFASALPRVSPGSFWGSTPNQLAPGLAVLACQVRPPSQGNGTSIHFGWQDSIEVNFYHNVRVQIIL
jgi:hypothetical protein